MWNTILSKTQLRGNKSATLNPKKAGLSQLSLQVENIGSSAFYVNPVMVSL